METAFGLFLLVIGLFLFVIGINVLSINKLLFKRNHDITKDIYNISYSEYTESKLVVDTRDKKLQISRKLKDSCIDK
jgi:hypothetical protein